MEQIDKLKLFLTDVWAEMKKTTWPGRKEIQGTTVVVIATVLICAFYLWIVDLVLSRGMNGLLEALK